ncbi:MAG: translation initiation factor IF-2, partial [Acidobacteriota bacterium]
MRINELARELEVKAKAIIDYLAEAGVEGKKSHSSSIEHDLAEKVRAHFRQKEKEAEKAASTEPEAAPKAPDTATPVASTPAPVVEPAKSVQAREVPGEARTAVPLRKPAISEGTPGRRTPLRPPIRSQGAPKPVQPPPGRPILEQKPPPRSAERPAAAGKVAGKRGAPLGPAKPGEPIYSKRPIHPAGRPSRTSGAPAPGRLPMQGEPARRGMHPVRGRPPGAPARGERERRAQQSRERSLRVVAPPKPPPPVVIDRDITITEGITVKDLSGKLGLKVRDLIRRLLDMGIFATINQILDPSLAEQVAKSFGAGTTIVGFEEEVMQQVELEETPGNLVARPPVVTVMGHVDHGKTSLLDAIRETNVASREAGGITQHIGAYAVTINERKIVFVDTPGHEAFTRMRARGSKVTDIVVLVVAADDGVMPQTLEAINHARAAKVPILVAINKVDKPGAMTDRVKTQLSEQSLVSEDWGGDTVMVEVSAKEKKNIPLLLEMILLVADMQSLKANPERPAQGTVLEAKLDKGRGPVSSVLVQNGTLRVADSFLVGAVFGKVRAMLDDLGMPVQEAPPSTPVEVLGLQSLPQAGEHFQVVSDLAKAKQTALYREGKLREINLAKSSRLTLEHLHDQLKAGAMKELHLILKADVQGSVEVFSESLNKLGGEQVKTK